MRLVSSMGALQRLWRIFAWLILGNTTPRYWRTYFFDGEAGETGLPVRIYEEAMQGVVVKAGELLRVKRAQKTVDSEGILVNVSWVLTVP